MNDEEVNNILLFLVKNGCYKTYPFTSAKVKYKEMKKAARSKSNWFYDTDWYIRPFLVEVTLLNNFLKIDQYDWNIIKPLYDKGLIWVYDGDGKHIDYVLSHLPEEFINGEKQDIGLVKDYQTGISYFSFWFGNCDPNDHIDKTELVKIK